MYCNNAEDIFYSVLSYNSMFQFFQSKNERYLYSILVAMYSNISLKHELQMIQITKLIILYKHLFGNMQSLHFTNHQSTK